MEKLAVVLSSGGIDSTTVLAIAKELGFKIYSLSFNYGQRNEFELKCAKEVAQSFNVEEHLIIDIELDKIGGSALTDNIDVPKNRQDINSSNEIPKTYVPARNTIFLSLALGWAEVLGAQDIFIGVNTVDFSGYPDCRPEFIESFQKMANLATKTGVEGGQIKIHTPLINMSKSEIIKKGIELEVDFRITSSCYDPVSDRTACGECDSCLLRKKGFEEAGLEDPIKYVVPVRKY